MKGKNPIKGHDARKAFPRIEHYVHLIYFALVAVSGPYHVAAGACFVLGIVVLLVAREG